MTRRSRLDLSPGKDRDKPLPDGFDMADTGAQPGQDPPRPGPRAAVQGTTREGAQANGFGQAADTAADTVSVRPGWTANRQLIRILAVVAATAVSLYFLKRKLF